jgi:hypothetical protein
MNYIVKTKNESYQTGDGNSSTYELWDGHSLFSLSCSIEKRRNYYNITDINISFHNSEGIEIISKLDDYESIATLNQILFHIKDNFGTEINRFLSLDVYPNKVEIHKAKMIYKYQDKVNDIYKKSLELEKLNNELLELLSNESTIFIDGGEETIINTNLSHGNLIFSFDKINELMK